MDNLRDHIVKELATLNPSKLVGNRLHRHVERRFLDLIADLRTPTHPPYASMIHRAIEELNEGGGSSEKAISEFIVREYENLPLGHEDILRLHLGKLCQKGQVLCTVDGRYSLRVGGGAVKKGAVGVEWKRRKRRRGRRREVNRPSAVEHRGVEETKSGEIGEESQWMEQETEQTEAQVMRVDRIDEKHKGEEEQEEVFGNHDRGNEEKNEVFKEQSEAVRLEMEMHEAQEALGNLDQGNEKSEAEKQEMEVTKVQFQMTSRNLNDKRGSNGEEIVQEFIKEKTKASENKECIEAGEQQHERIKEQQLGISTEQNEPQPEQTGVVERQFQLEEAKKQQHEVQPEQAEVIEKQTDVIEEQQLGMSLKKDIQPQQVEAIEKQIQLEEVQKQHQQESCGQQDKTKIKHDTISASTPTATTSLGGPSSDDQQANLEKQPEIPIMQWLPKFKSAKKKKLFLPQQQAQDQSLLQRRKLRSYTQSLIAESVTSSTISEPSLLSQQLDELQQRALYEGKEKQYQQRPAKQNRDEKTNVKMELFSNFHPHHNEQPLKRHKVHGMLPKPTPDVDAIKDALDVQAQSEQQQHKAQLPQSLLRSYNKKPSISESANPTMTLSSTPFENQDTQARHQGRLSKPIIDADTNEGSALSFALQHPEEEEKLPPKLYGRRSTPKLNTDMDLNAGSAVSLASQHHEDKQLPKPRGWGRPQELKTATKFNAGSALSFASRPYRLGRPPNPIPSKYMLKKYGKYPFPLGGRGRGRPRKEKKDTKISKDVILPSNNYVKMLKQTHPKGQGRPQKAKGRPSEGCHLPEQPRKNGRGRPRKPKLEADTANDESADHINEASSTKDRRVTC